MNKFEEIFKHYNTNQLLKIVNNKDNYEVAAVEVAQALLNKRTITEDDLKRYELQIEKELEQKEEEKKSIKFKIIDFLEPILHPYNNVNPNKWVNIILLLISIEVFIKLKYFVEIIYQVKHFNLTDSFFFVYLLFKGSAVLIIQFYLIYKRQQWGWFLLFFSTTFLFCYTIPKLIFDNEIEYVDIISWHLRAIIFSTLYLFILYKDDVALLFKIEIDSKKTYAVRIIGISIALLISTMFILYTHLLE